MCRLMINAIMSFKAVYNYATITYYIELLDH